MHLKLYIVSMTNPRCPQSPLSFPLSSLKNLIVQVSPCLSNIICNWYPHYCWKARTHFTRRFKIWLGPLRLLPLGIWCISTQYAIRARSSLTLSLHQIISISLYHFLSFSLFPNMLSGRLISRSFSFLNCLTHFITPPFPITQSPSSYLLTNWYQNWSNSHSSFT